MTRDKALDDLISRQGVIDYVLEHGFYCDTEADKEYTAELIRTVFPPAQQWIPWVEHDTRLKDHYYYLVTHKSYGTPMKAKYHDDGGYFEMHIGHTYLSVYQWDGEITAWMPMPDVYKGDEDAG